MHLEWMLQRSVIRIFKETFLDCNLKTLFRNPTLSQSRSACAKNLNCVMTLPKLIVFDLDYTLWPFWVDTHVDPPFRKTSDGKVYDRSQREVQYYHDVPDILQKLHSEGFQLAIASRTGAPQEANALTRLFVWDQFFQYRQIYPGCKITHFKKLHSLTGIPYKDMLFFDDEHRNIRDVSSLGVTCMFVPDGVDQQTFEQGIQLFQKNRNH